MDKKQEFLDILTKNVQRKGISEFIKWLESTDFFIAPASSKFHAAYPGGLAEHCLNVYYVLTERYFDKDADNIETFTICALLHDICKTGFYELSKRNVKNEQGVWEQVDYYTINDKFPYGHGDKSVFLIERHMKLKLEEAIAIRWHMGGFDDNAKAGGFSVSNAFNMYPLAVKMHLADLEASYLRESR